MISPFLTAAAFTAPTSPVPPSLCSVGKLRGSPGYRYRVERIQQLVDSATVIARAVAVGVDTSRLSNREDGEQNKPG